MELLCENLRVFENMVNLEPVTSFEITIPVEFDFYTQLPAFHLENRKKFIVFSNFLVFNKNYQNVSDRLTPGERYKISFYEILRRTNGKFCYLFTKRMSGLMVGPQGLFLIWELKKQFFPSGSTFMFDKENNLYSYRGEALVPFVHREGDFFDASAEAFDGTFKGYICVVNKI